MKIEPIYKELGLRIQRIRETLGMSQADLAANCGLTRTSITNIEAGRQRILFHDLEKIAAGLHVAPKHLLRGIWTQLVASRKDAKPPAERISPQSLEAEQGVIGCILLSPTECMMQCVQQFPGPEVFYDMRLRTVYQLLCVMHDAREAIDMITIQQRLKDKNQLEAVGGLQYLASLPDAVPSHGEIQRYAGIVFDKFKRRSIIQGCTEIEQRCYDGASDAEDYIETIQRDLIRLAQMTNRKGDWSVKEALKDAIKDIEADIQSGGALTGLPTGFSDLDRKTRGLQAQDFVVIAARPSMGKSALVMNMADHQAVERHIPVGVFSLEMSKKSLIRRMISARARINLFHLDNDLLAGQELDKLSQAAGKIAQAPLYIDDTSGMDDVQIRSKIRQMYHEHGIKIAIIDYLQLLHARKRFDNRAQEVAHISNGMKDIARELGIPVVVCAQLNRDVLNRKGERPRISDLKESGGIEQDADLIGLLYPKNPDEDDQHSYQVPSALFIGKQRNGPTGTVQLLFRKDIFRFESVSKISAEDVPQDPRRYI